MNQGEGAIGKEGDSQGALVGVPASFNEVEANLNDRVVLEDFAAQDPVTTVETGQVRSDVLNLAIPICKVRVVTHS